MQPKKHLFVLHSPILAIVAKMTIKQFNLDSKNIYFAVRQRILKLVEGLAPKSHYLIIDDYYGEYERIVEDYSISKFCDFNINLYNTLIKILAPELNFRLKTSQELKELYERDANLLPNYEQDYEQVVEENELLDLTIYVPHIIDRIYNSLARFP